MADKVKIEARKSGDRIEVAGLDEIVHAATLAENIICKYEKFAEDVILSCAMPEIPRYSLHDDEKPEMIAEAEDVLYTLLTRYRKMTEWMRKNGIDIEAVVGNEARKTKS